MTNPTTPYISNYAGTVYPSYKYNLDLNITSIKSQFTLAGAYGGSRMYMYIGEAILATEKAFYVDISGAVEYYQGFFDISISETYAIYNSYGDLFKIYTSSLGSSSSSYNNLLAQDLSAQKLYLIALTTPWVVISSSKTSIVGAETATLTFRLSESSVSFGASDISVSGGVISDFSGSDRLFYAIFTPDKNLKGAAVIGVSNEKFTDSVGNPNLDEAFNKISLAIDTIVPDTLAPTVNTFSPSDEAQPSLSAATSC